MTGATALTAEAPQIIVPDAIRSASRRGTRRGIASARVTKKVVGKAVTSPSAIAMSCRDSKRRASIRSPISTTDARSTALPTNVSPAP